MMLFGKKEKTQITLKIEGMHCEMCSSRMQKAFLNAKGVYDAEVDLENKCARVTYDAGKLKEEDLKNIIRETGYQPV